MTKRYAIDCSKYPSDPQCDLKITGSDRKAVVDAAYNHAIGPMHRYEAKPGLREDIDKMVQEEELETV